ncbi:response regulator [Candidatus Woesearchaeota archaeon]|nr:response regulator [Candidatus Woesearchaeota archaeon]
MGKKTIMVVDDEQVTIDMLNTILTNEGYDVLSVLNGKECMDQLKSGVRPDLILLDIMMPDMDGWDVSAAIKSDPKLKEIPIAFLTAKTDSISKSMGTLTSVEYIEKPFEIQALLDTIKKIVKKAQ